VSLASGAPDALACASRTALWPSSVDVSAELLESSSEPATGWEETAPLPAALEAPPPRFTGFRAWCAAGPAAVGGSDPSSAWTPL
jgi:hypothetical protein